MKLITGISKLIIGGLLFFLLNNLAANLLSVLLFNHYEILLYGFNCGVVTPVVIKTYLFMVLFTLFKIAILGFSISKYPLLRYYVFWDVFFVIVYLSDKILPLNSPLTGYYISNKPFLMLSNLLFNSYLLAVLYGIFAGFIYIYLYLKKHKNHAI